MSLRDGEPLIHDGNYRNFCFLDPSGREGFGLVPRNYSTHPLGCYASAQQTALDFPTIPQSEWEARIQEMEETKSRLSDILLAKDVPCLDQAQRGYCWMHSGVGCVQGIRALMNLPTVGLSAYGPACVIKNFRDEGGWGAQGLDFLTERGVPSEEFWPMQAVDRRYDNPRTWENAALHRVTEGWVDLGDAVYDRSMTFEQVATCLLLRIPVILDFNWWGHSVFGCDLVVVERGSYGFRIRNSWGPGWGDRGFGVLQGSKARPNGASAPRVVRAAAA